MNGFVAGFTLGFSLIIAIGSQNAFVLRQALKKEHVFIVCLLCAVSDALLITLGISGISAVLTEWPWIEQIAMYGGAGFLLFYGARSFLSSFQQGSLTPSDHASTTVLQTASICLGLTWLNPHVYLDTVLLIGSVASQFPADKIYFAIGAVLASFIFFFSLGYGARVLIPLFKNPKSWKVLDFSIGIVMWFIAFKLLKGSVFF